MKRFRTKDYWIQRGEKSYSYQGDIFYTTTPIPLYVRRRKLLLEMVIPYLMENSVKNILDFGCGDGWYTAYFNHALPKNNYYGCDISPTMIQRAKSGGLGTFVVNNSTIPFDVQFDVVYCFAVFAHIMEEDKLENAYSDIYKKLNPGGRFLLFEQTAKKLRQREAWARRTVNKYIELGNKHGFNLEKTNQIAFPLFSYYERILFHQIIKYCFSGNSWLDKYIRSNQSKSMNRFHEALINISEYSWLKRFPSCWENTLFIFRKPND